MLDVDQAGEIKAALRRGDWTNAEIKKACEGNFLSQVRNVLRGHAEIKMIEHMINCDVPVFVPENWEVLPDIDQLPNRIRGQVKFDLTKVNLHLVNGQKKGKCIEGNQLRKELVKERVYTAHVLDYLLVPKNQHLIPEAWKEDENGNTRYIFFWGTIYRGSDGGLCVRCLCWGGGGWCWYCGWLGGDWVSDSPAAVSAS